MLGHAIVCHLQIASDLVKANHYVAKHRERRVVAASIRRSRCPVSCTLDLLGDRWTLLVVRDLVFGKRRYGDFLESPEGIPTNILADRLKRLVETGIVQSRQYSEHPPRLEYALTAKGTDLRPVLRAMVDWGVRHAGGRKPPRVPSHGRD